MARLRPYQTNAIDAVERAIAAGKKRVLLQAPVGSGKTICATELIRRLPKPALFLAHSVEIVAQSAAALRDSGQMVEVLTAETRTDPGSNMNIMEDDCEITVASQMTAWSRAVRAGHELRHYKTIIADECHRARAKTWTDIFALWPDANLIGLSATPARSDGRGLGNVFDELVQGASYDALIEDGFLVDAPLGNIWSWPADLSGVREQMGDYAMGGAKGAAQKLDTLTRVGDCVSHWIRLAKNRQTIIYASSVSHAHHLRDRFVAEGIRADAVDAQTPRQERQEMLNNLRAGKIKIVVNFGCLTEGFDCPPVSCIVLERPTKHFGLYLQMLGRGLRIAPGKKDLMILDHVGAVLMHGLPTQDIAWSLSSDNKAAKSNASASSTPLPMPCPQCNRVFRRPPCICGWKPAIITPSGQFEPVAGALVRMSDALAANVKRIRSDPRRAEFYRYKAVAKKNGFKPGWAAVKFKEAHGEWPPFQWELPDPAADGVTSNDYYNACVEFADNKGWKRGWAKHQFKAVYGIWEPNPLQSNQINQQNKEENSNEIYA